jgi:aminoglycoside phosphotransferase (APT) family kinase protein
VVRRPSAFGTETSHHIAQREYRVVQFAAAGQLRVPTPLYFEPQRAAIIMDHVAGNPDFAPRDLQGALKQMATELAKLHQLRLTAEVEGLPQREALLKSALDSVPAEPDESLNERLVRAQLGERFPWQDTNPSALLHGDYWPGNLVWQSGELKAIIDWEECCLGDPLADVALTRLDILWAFGEDAMSAFTRHYRELTALDWRHLPLWDLANALRPMSKLQRWASAYGPPPISRPDITEQTMRDGHRRFVAQALAALGQH